MIPHVIHRRMRRLKKKQKKQEAMLRDMIVPTTQYKFSRAEIDNDIIVIDGGIHPCPPFLRQKESNGDQFPSKTYTLKMRQTVALVFRTPK
jgi:hypothetical protein